jgi:2-hydroxy-4-carboxymuconate semialdehyde hemiacetal dehydrogenase
MKLAIIGYGAVASIHARKALAQPGLKIAAVSGPRRDKAAIFASTYGIANYTDRLSEALCHAEAAIICSPSAAHFEQACECLKAGIHTLVELPPCGGLQEAERLSELAAERDVLIRCAHTSRYLSPFIRLREILRAGEVGEIEQVSYVRHHVIRERSWTDSALLHHAAHPLDLFIDWFGNVRPLACVVSPDVVSARNVSFLGRLASGAPVSVSISYTSRLPRKQMIVVGTRHTVETDGFSYIRSDSDELKFDGDEQLVYEKAIADQDGEFVRACQGERCGVGWEETIKLVELVDLFRATGEQDLEQRLSDRSCG